MKCWRALALAAFCVATVAGQQRPDFTGTWKSVGDENRVTVQRIEHRDPYLKVVLESRDTGKSSLPRPLASVYDTREFRTDGSEEVEGIAGDRQRWRSVFWEDSSLVIATVVRNGYRVTSTRSRWSLSDEGRTLTIAIRVVDMDGVRETVQTFRKE